MPEFILAGQSALTRGVNREPAAVQEVGQKIKDALHAQNAAPVIVELDWKESVLHEDDRQAPLQLSLQTYVELMSRRLRLCTTY